MPSDALKSEPKDRIRNKNVRALQSKVLSLHPGVEAQETQFLFTQEKIATSISGVIALGVLLVMLSQVPLAYTVAWAALFFGATAVRGMTVRAFYHRDTNALPSWDWRQIYLVITLVTGALWGLCGFLFWYFAAFNFQAMLSIVLAGIASGGIVTLAASWRCYLVFLAFCLAPITVGLLLDGTPGSVSLGAMAIAFYAGMALVSRIYSRSLHDSWALELRNAALIDELSSINQRAEETNRRLEAEVTERKQDQAAIIASDRRYRTLFDQAPIAIWEEDWSVARVTLLALLDDGIVDVEAYLLEHPEMAQKLYQELEYLDFNAAALTLYHANDKLELARHFRRGFDVDDERRVFCEAAGALAKGLKRAVFQGWEKRCDGDEIYLRTTIFVPEDIRAGGDRLVCTNEDITEQHNLSRKLTHQASHDALTGLVNRREFEERLRRVLRSSQIGKTENALCYLDLDQFKLINDTCGHLAGDEMLRKIGALLEGEVRQRDTLARLGGDEFGVLMEHCSLANAERIANSLLHEIGKYRFVWEGQSFSIGASLGVVPVLTGEQEFGEVLKAADAACYAAKDAGRNRVFVYHPDDQELAHRRGEMQWVTRLSNALAENRFRLFAQAIYPVQQHTRSPNCYEVLLRMEGECGELVLPGAFLPAAERFGLSQQVDHWVVAVVLHWLASHPDASARVDFLSVNLSGQSLSNTAFTEFLIAELTRNHVAANKLCFEITETAVISNLSTAKLFLRELRELGCRIALDDFGSGLSSFAYLKALPVDFIKIDGLFVKDIEQDAIDKAMVASINDIGHIMGIHTIAEFVENDAILAILASIGVDMAQGYGLGRPLPIDDVVV